MNKLKLKIQARQYSCARTHFRKATHLFLFAFFFSAIASTAIAQPPSHDPSTMIQGDGGRYWIFTTGDGIWCMSSSNPDFTDWRAETTPFPIGSWPGWINNYVSGFGGSFWAPDIIQMNGYYYLYYSVSSFGSSRSAIGVVRTPSLANPSWTDLGMVVSSNGGSSEINAIDPGLFRDSDGRVWMSYGSWFGGIAVVEINPSTGKTTGGITHLLGGGHIALEAPNIFKNGGYYYLFVNRGTCCNGVNSSYYITVLRSTTVTGPYSGERTFIANTNGNIIGPGHFGYGADRLTYHYYDGNDNGAAKLAVTTMGWQNGWPVAGATGGWDNGSSGGGSGANISNGTYRITPVHSGKALEVAGSGTANGTNVQQWSYNGSAGQHWVLTNTGDNWYQISPSNVTGRALDVAGVSVENGANLQIWDYWSGEGQQWKFVEAGNGGYQIVARHSGQCLDVYNLSTSDGANLVQWPCISGNNNQVFLLEVPGGGEPECNPTGLTPYLQVDGGSWQQTSSITINEGSSVKFGPQPTSGSWSWNGCGTSGSSREQTIYPGSSCSATATYTNDCGAQSSITFNITVNSNSGGNTPVTLTLQENESGFCSVDGSIDNNNSGYTGSGFANTDNANGNGINWNISGDAGEYTFRWRYANGSSTDRTGVLSINGSNVSTRSFPGTGSWTNWTTTSATISNVAGGAKAIRLEANQSSGLSNIDYLEITGPGISLSGCLKEASEEFASEQPLPESIALYPNPVNDILTIQFAVTLEKGALLKIFDHTGRLLFSDQIQGQYHLLDISNFSAGYYLLQITSGDTIMLKQVVKN